MAIPIQGNGGVVADVGGTAFRGLKVMQTPIDHGSLGHYRLNQRIGLVVTQAANGTLFSFRWADATRLALITYLRLQCLQTAAATATIFPSFEVLIARSFTVADSAGTAVTLTGNNLKKRTSHGTSLVNDIRFSAVAAGLTVGTRTLDANTVLELPTSQVITTPTPTLYQNALDMTDGNDHPITLAQNEGIIVRGPTTVFGAAGTANLVVDMAWAEVSAY